MASSATENSPAKINEERRKRVYLGALPPDFLRPVQYGDPQGGGAHNMDREIALALQNEYPMGYQSNFVESYPVGRLKISVVQATLTKNYGLVTKMDPYVRLRLGHCIYETHTDPSGGKFPRWNKEVLCNLPQGVHSIYVEIFDENAFSVDELIAWAKIPIPQSVIKGETHEDWYDLSGKQGENKEGKINLVLSFSNVPMNPQFVVPPVVMVPKTGGALLNTQYAPYAANFGAANVYVQPPNVPPQSQQIAPPPQPPVQLSEKDLKNIQEMFPNMDADVVKSIYEMNRGNQDMTVHALLQMSE